MSMKTNKDYNDINQSHQRLNLMMTLKRERRVDKFISSTNFGKEYVPEWSKFINSEKNKTENKNRNQI